MTMNPPNEGAHSSIDYDRAVAYVPQMWAPSPEVEADKGHRWTWRRNAQSRLRDQLDEQIGEPPKSPSWAFRGLVAEADLRAYEARRSAKRWRRTYYILGLPAAVLAAVSAATGLASTAGRIPAAIIALVAAGLSSAVAFLNSDQRANAVESLSASWQGLADDARMKVLTYPDPVDGGAVSSDLEQETNDALLKLWRRKSRLLRGDLSPDPDDEKKGTG